jgi:hypothetical protein
MPMPIDLEKKRQRQKEYYQENKDKILARHKEYYVSHLVEHAKWQKQWDKDNKQHRQSYLKSYYKRNVKRIKDKENKRYKLQSPEERRVKYRRKYHGNKEAYSQYESKKRARRNGAPINDFTLAQWQAMKEHYDHRCVYCSRKMQHLTQDHLTPLSKEGSHTTSNIVPACRSCNSRKHTGTPLVPVQPLLLI